MVAWSNVKVTLVVAIPGPYYHTTHFHPGNVWNRREDRQYYKQLFGKPRISCETPRARVYTMFGILMIFFWMAY